MQCTLSYKNRNVKKCIFEKFNYNDYKKERPKSFERRSLRVWMAKGIGRAFEGVCDLKQKSVVPNLNS